MEGKSRKPHEKSTDELRKNEKFLKMAIAMTAIAAGLMVTIGIYSKR